MLSKGTVLGIVRETATELAPNKSDAFVAAVEEKLDAAIKDLKLHGCLIDAEKGKKIVVRRSHQGGVLCCDYVTTIPALTRLGKKLIKKYYGDDVDAAKEHGVDLEKQNYDRIVLSYPGEGDKKEFMVLDTTIIKVSSDETFVYFDITIL